MTDGPHQMRAFHLSEARLEDMLDAMASGRITAVELTVLHLNRIMAFDRQGPRLNSIPVLNPTALDEATQSDRRWVAGQPRPLEGVPFTVKDSYKVKGLTVAAGSPAFKDLVADEDAFTVARLREAGAVLIGKTNMPPLADGGLQRGLYGRAESPYAADYLTAAWNSGSSNGSGTSTAAGFAAFSMGEETVSSGRSPASNNALVAYTPSRALISLRGNWPLRPLRDVVVPMARCIADLFRVLDVIVAEDLRTDGDFWRWQSVVELPTAAQVRPERYGLLADRNALRGKRIGVPGIYLGNDTSGAAFHIRPSILDLWRRAAADLERLGASVVEVDFPLFHDYEEDTPEAQSPAARGLIPAEWWNDFTSGVLSSSRSEKVLLSAWAWDTFVRGCNDPRHPSWANIAPELVFPYPEGSVDRRRKGPHDRLYEEIGEVIRRGPPHPLTLPGLESALRGLEAIRRQHFEQWLTDNHLDCIAFPANGDVARASSDTVDDDYDFAISRGVSVSNGGGMIRHLGIPTVSAPMGEAQDLGMPVNITFAGAAYSDNALLAYAYAYEQATLHRHPPGRTPPLHAEGQAFGRRKAVSPTARGEAEPPVLSLCGEAQLIDAGRRAALRFSGTAASPAGLASLQLFINGHAIPCSPGDTWCCDVPVSILAEALAFEVILLVRDQLGAAAAVCRQVAVTPLRLDPVPAARRPRRRLQPGAGRTSRGGEA